MDQLADQTVRSDVYRAIQGVLDRYDLLVTPTVACLPVRNTEDGNTLGPSEIEGKSVLVARLNSAPTHWPALRDAPERLLNPFGQAFNSHLGI
jgi:Asp-tRNA(Asn)/Glu-tRNA(Gln) amidotransferase A subunit family amidase